MARVNVGCNPLHLADQHLIAESVEITMIVGSLRKNGYCIKGDCPDVYKLGKGHINFFKKRLKYLARRLEAVNKEMIRREFKPGTTTECLEIAPREFQNDWQPTIEDSMIVRNRIVEKMIKKPEGFWRYEGELIADVTVFSRKLLQSNLYVI